MRIEILMATQNGRTFLPDQFDSLIWQETKPWRITVRDNGSVDDTLDMVRRYELRARPRVVPAARLDHAAAHMALLHLASEEAEAYALCGQDDIWHEDKLGRARAALMALPQDRPALYCARARFIGPQAQPLGLSPAGRREVRLADVLLAPLAAGETFVLNRAARRVIHPFLTDAVPCWNWWLMLALLACGGLVVFDKVPALDLRLHAQKWRAHMGGHDEPHLTPEARGRVLDLHLAALLAHAPRLSADALTVLRRAAARHDSAAARRAFALLPGLQANEPLQSLRLRYAVWRGRL